MEQESGKRKCGLLALAGRTPGGRGGKGSSRGKVLEEWRVNFKPPRRKGPR